MGGYCGGGGRVDVLVIGSLYALWLASKKNPAQRNHPVKEGTENMYIIATESLAHVPCTLTNGKLGKDVLAPSQMASLEQM